MKEKILVTGGTGYIGSHTVVELQNAGYEVVIIDNLSNSSADVVDNIEKVSGIRPAFEKLDCLDYAGLDAVFTKYKGIKAIIHFAASKAVGESVQKPLLYYRNNLVSLINLLELMPKHGVEGIVFSSSCTVYGQPDELPVTEKAPIKKAESPYGNTKQINEEIVRDTVASGAPINAILLRYFNPIGAHPTALLGELPNGVPQNLIPYLTQTAIGIREKLSVFGDDYDTPDGSCIRDFINVVDLAKAHVVAIRRILENKQKEKVEVFNIGTGRGLSVLELINAFEKATGVKLNYQIVGRRAGDIEKVWANPELANNELGWKAETSIEDTLLSAMERAGNEELTEDTEKKGLGTPATRAAIIEKLIQSGFVKREKKNLVPTDDGNVLITVLPDEIKSPKMTAEWEMALNHIAQNTETADEFLNGITELMQELVARYQGISEEKKEQFQGKAKGEVIGKCPRCGADVREGKVNFYCSDRNCAFTLWKNDKFLASQGKRMDKTTAKKFLSKGKIHYKDLVSRKTGRQYEATVEMVDPGEGNVQFNLSFPQR